MRSLLFAALCVGVVACDKPAPVQPKRTVVNRVGGTLFQLVPAEGQHRYCLAYTVSREGLVRQLTMSRNNQSFECPAGKPVGNRSFKVPLSEGPVKVLVFFTSQPVNAASVSQQILEASDRQAINIMNMRLPGQASLDMLEFAPEEDVAPEVGGIVEPDGGTVPSAAPDAGSADAAADAGTP